MFNAAREFSSFFNFFSTQYNVNVPCVLFDYPLELCVECLAKKSKLTRIGFFPIIIIIIITQNSIYGCIELSVYFILF